MMISFGPPAGEDTLRRPALLTAAGYAAGILLTYSWKTGIAVLAACLILVIFPSGGNDRSNVGFRRSAVLFLSFALLGGVMLLITDAVPDYYRDGLTEIRNRASCGAGISPEMQTEITGRVLSCNAGSEDKCTMIIGTDKGPRVQAVIYGDPAGFVSSVGKTVRAAGKMYLPSGSRNPGGFDQALYLRSKKVSTVMTADAGHVITGRTIGPVMNRLCCFKVNFGRALDKYTGEKNASVISGMMFGDKSGIDEETYDMFRLNGTAHILAVSGLHVGIIYAFVSALIGGRRKTSTNIIMLFLLTAYAALADFSPSVMRAVIMIAMHILANMRHFRYDLLSAAAVSALVMMLYSPYSVFSAGFRMSYLAVFSMGMLMPYAEKISSSKVFGCFVPVLVVQTGMAPFTAYVFNYFSLSAFIANIPIVFLAGIMIPCGAVTAAAYVIMPFAFPACSFVLSGLASMMTAVNKVFYLNGHAGIDTVSPPLFVLCVYYGIIFVGFSEMFRIHIARCDMRAAARSAAAVMLACLAAAAVSADSMMPADIFIVDVGQGSCLLASSKSGKHVMIDGGGKPSFGGGQKFDVGKKTVKPFLLKNGIRKVDLAVVSHLDTDHYDGIASLCREGMVKKLAVNRSKQDVIGRILEETMMRPEDVVYLETGDVIKEDDLRLDVLGPVEDTDDENDGCLIIKIEAGETSVITAGDITAEVEQKLTGYYCGTDTLHADILCAPHHGSRFSSSAEFIRAVDPTACVFQTGKNNYGHPDPGIVQRYQDMGIAVYRTDGQGAVSFRNGKVRWHITE
ncbi:MAG: DNA internalization-related competence protein ComEC/Rec2 [Eubacteriaceae bacterium]|jgi:competence protein ComEC|nr:DNA internalization-related competence protein ComEC/Rec2 [Eubacteriaceae bacterium]